MKSLLDLAKGGDVKCRNRDGHIPARTPRIFSTSWPRDLFGPRLASSPVHEGAITRRTLWFDVKSDLRAPAVAMNAQGLIFV